jgi:hypothetical protein
MNLLNQCLKTLTMRIIGMNNGLEMSATTPTELEQLLEMENRDGKITLHW